MQSAELSVVAEGLSGTAEYPSFLELCAIGEAVSLCNTPVVLREGRLLVDDTLSRGFGPKGVPFAGRSLDDVWTITSAGWYRAALKHFDGTRWREIRRFTIREEHPEDRFSISTWTPGCVVVLLSPPLLAFEERTVQPLELSTYGKNCPPLPKIVSNDQPAIFFPSSVHAFQDGTLVVTGSASDGGLIVEKWTKTSLPSTSIRGPACAGEVQVISGEEQVFFGRDEAGPCAQRNVRGKWADLNLPRGDLPAQARVTSYAREPGGTEFLVIEDGVLTCGSSCHEKHRGEL